MHQRALFVNDERPTMNDPPFPDCGRPTAGCVSPKEPLHHCMVPLHLHCPFGQLPCRSLWSFHCRPKRPFTGEALCPSLPFSIFFSIRSFVFQHDGDGAPDKDDVEPDVPVADVPGVHLDAFVVGRIAAAAGLPHAGDAGADHVEVFDVRAVFGDFGLDDRPRADEAHFPFEDVEELGQFVEAGLAQEGAALGDARVVLQFEFCFPFFAGLRIACEEFLQFHVGIDAHAAEFVAVEFFAVPADAAVFEDDRSRRILVDPEGDGQKERRQAEDAEARADDVEDALDGAIVPEGQVVAEAEGDDVAVDEAFRVERSQGQAAHVGDEGDFLHERLDAVDDVLDGGAAQARRDDHDVLDAGHPDDFFGIAEAAEVRHHGSDGRFRRVVFEIADEFIVDARILFEVIEDDGRRLAGAHNQDGQLEHLEMAQGVLDDVAFGDEEEERRDPEESHEEARRRGRCLSDVNQENEGNHGIENGFKDTRNDLPELHAPCIKMMDLQKEQVHSGHNDMDAEPGQVEMRARHEEITQTVRHIDSQPDGDIVTNRQDQRHQLVAVLIFNGNRMFRQVLQGRVLLTAQ